MQVVTNQARLCGFLDKFEEYQSQCYDARSVIANLECFSLGDRAKELELVRNRAAHKPETLDTYPSLCQLLVQFFG